MSSGIQGKTIRPGGLRYTYYQSGVNTKKKAVAKSEPKKKGHFKSLLFILVLIIAAPLIYTTVHRNLSTANSSSTIHHNQTQSTKTPVVTTPSKTPATTQATAPLSTVCSSNQLSKLLLVSISQRHMWACNGTTVAYDSPVVTGDEEHADTLTPVGTYHIYAMATNRTLTGSDENGSWNDYVYYWMPFLYNQYGAYGFHDATWRPANAFGNIDPNTANASNGCVELPLATAKWVYDWADVGTTVTIES